MKARKSNNRKSFFRCVCELSRPATTVLLVGLPIIALELLLLLSGFLEELNNSPLYAVSIYPPMFEYIMMSLTILTGGALLIDYMAKK